MNDIESKVDNLARDVQHLNDRVDNLQRSFENVGMIVQNNVHKALELEFTKLDEKINNHISTAFDKQKLQKYEEKEKQMKDYKAHAVKSGIGIIVGIVAGLIVFIYGISITISNKNNKDMADYYINETIKLQEEIKKIKGGI